MVSDATPGRADERPLWLRAAPACGVEPHPLPPQAMLFVAPLSFSPPAAELSTVAPALHAFMTRAKEQPEIVAAELKASFPELIVPEMESMPRSPTANASLPMVVAHGMGDSCFNPGMKSITKAAGDRLGVYSVCIPTGNNLITE